MFDLPELLIEYDRARAYTDALWRDLSSEEVIWRPTPNSSAIGWHLGHQAHVAHFMLRNLIAAEASPDPALDALMDSANPEPGRGNLPSLDQLAAFRAAVAARIHARMAAIDAREIGAPAQQRAVGRHLLTVLIDHEYQHDRWISEVRGATWGTHCRPNPPAHASPSSTTTCRSSTEPMCVGRKVLPRPDRASPAEVVGRLGGTVCDCGSSRRGVVRRRVVDPETGLDRLCDVGIDGRRIARLAMRSRDRRRST